MRDLGLPFMNSTIRDSVTNHHLFSMRRTKIKFYGWKVIMSQLKSMTLLQPPDLKCLSKYKVSKHSNLLCIMEALIRVPSIFFPGVFILPVRF